MGERDLDVQEALMQLRGLVVGEEDLYIGSDENSLLPFLYWADFDVEAAFEKMKGFYKWKAEHKDWCAHFRDPQLHDVILKRGIHQMLDTRDQNGRRIYILRLGNMKYGEYEPNQMFQVDEIWGILAMDEEETLRNGVMMLADFQNMSWKFLKYFTSPYYIKITAQKLENIPFKNWQFHTINAGIVLHALVTIAFPFLSQSIKEKVFFHKSLESLHSQISPSALPADYGGECPPLDSAKLVREYIDPRTDRLNELLSYGYRDVKTELSASENEDEDEVSS